MQAFKLILYLMAIATNVACTILLFRGYVRRKVRLLMWSALCFAALTGNNILLFIDLVIFPDRDFRLPRLLTALVGVSILLYGFIWEAD